MLDQEDRVAPDWLQQLAGGVFLAGCAAMVMAMSRPKPKAGILPSVEADEPVEPKTRKKRNPSPEVQEFMRLPPHIQRQGLNYAKNWIDANFERMC